MLSTFSAPDYRGEGPKPEKWARSEGPPSEGEGEFLRITRLGRCIRMYGVAEERVDSDDKVYNFRSPWPCLLLLTSLPLSLPVSLPLSLPVSLPVSLSVSLPISLPISSAFAFAAQVSHSSIKF